MCVGNIHLRGREEGMNYGTQKSRGQASGNVSEMSSEMGMDVKLRGSRFIMRLNVLSSFSSQIVSGDWHIIVTLLLCLCLLTHFLKRVNCHLTPLA